MTYSNEVTTLPLIFGAIIFFVCLMYVCDGFVNDKKETIITAAVSMLSNIIICLSIFYYLVAGLVIPDPEIREVEKFSIKNKWVSSDLDNLHLYITEIIDEDTIIEKLEYKDIYHHGITWKPEQYYSYRIKDETSKED